MAIFRLHQFPLRRYDVILGQNDVILGHLRPKKGPTTKGHSFRKNDRIDLKIGQCTCFDALNPKIKQKYRNQHSIVYFWKSHCSIVFKQQRTIEKPRKQQILEILFTQQKNTIILGILTKFGVITITIAHFMNDFLFFEIYRKYIGFA